MNEEQLKQIAEEFKKTLSLEELDQLERLYNQMYQKAKREHEQSGSIQKAE